MHIYAIADLHLSHSTDKPMDVFGEAWRYHVEKLERNWRETVSEEDLVLIPGDISWAMQLNAALPDLAFIGRLPGRKILLKGNHDYWWSAIGRVRAALPENMRALAKTTPLRKTASVFVAVADGFAPEVQISPQTMKKSICGSWSG